MNIGKIEQAVQLLTQAHAILALEAEREAGVPSGADWPAIGSLRHFADAIAEVVEGDGIGTDSGLIDLPKLLRSKTAVRS